MCTGAKTPVCMEKQRKEEQARKARGEERDVLNWGPATKGGVNSLAGGKEAGPEVHWGPTENSKCFDRKGKRPGREHRVFPITAHSAATRVNSSTVN